MKKIALLIIAIIANISAYSQPDSDYPPTEKLPEGKSFDLNNRPEKGGRPPRGHHGHNTPHGGFRNNKSGAEKTYYFNENISSQWKYDKNTDIYYIIGIVYCATPADISHEQMGIYVPAEYMDATPSTDSTFTCKINYKGKVNGFTASTAPIVIPVNTPGYSAMAAPSGFNSRVVEFTSKGFIYLSAGCRGKDSGAPKGVTDLKAAIRYFRYLSDKQKTVPGNTNRIFSFGMSGGGAQSAILGASGNSPLYEKYLNAIGARTDFKDDIAGSMCWCPITNLDQADAAYEWNMGLTRTDLSENDRNISKSLAAEFANYINDIGFRHPITGEPLTLKQTNDGYYQSGSYYEFIIEIINDAVSRYNKYNNTDISTYNSKKTDALMNFSDNYKQASKGLAAFDDYDGEGRISAENQLFDPQGKSAHFDKYLASIINLYAPQYESVFKIDLSRKDSLNTDLDTRLAMYTPLYYLINNSKYYACGGDGSSNVAQYWRIRTGIKQGDTSLCTEANLALALINSGIKNVDFKTVWNQGHTEAEDSGKSNTNFIEWVEKCCK